MTQLTGRAGKVGDDILHTDSVNLRNHVARRIVRVGEDVLHVEHPRNGGVNPPELPHDFRKGASADPIGEDLFELNSVAAATLKGREAWIAGKAEQGETRLATLSAEEEEATHTPSAVR